MGMDQRKELFRDWPVFRQLPNRDLLGLDKPARSSRSGSLAARTKSADRVVALPQGSLVSSAVKNSYSTWIWGMQVGRRASGSPLPNQRDRTIGQVVRTARLNSRAA